MRNVMTMAGPFAFLSIAIFVACGGSNDGTSASDAGSASVSDGGSPTQADGGVASDAGWISQGGGTPTFDSLPTGHLNISADAGANSGLNPKLVIDAANSKLLVATDDGSNNQKPALFRCNTNGTACTYTDISAGAGAFSGNTPSIAIDSANNKVLVVTNDGSNSNKASLFRCNLDGTSCTYADISAGAGSMSGLSPSLAIDGANSKLLVVTDDRSNSDKPSLFRCNLDGTSCTYTDISAGAGEFAGLTPSIAIDETNSKLLVATESGEPGPYEFASMLGLFRCDLDGTSCTYVDVGMVAPDYTNVGQTPSLMIDAANGNILIVTSSGNNISSVEQYEHAALIRCALDGTSCAYFDVSAGGGSGSGYTPSIALDPVYGKLLVATDLGSLNSKLGLTFCNSAAKACTLEMFTNYGTGSGEVPSMAVDAYGNVDIVTQDESNGDRLSLFTIHR